MKQDKEFLKWKRQNVTLRGVKESIHAPNGIHASFGKGLYTCCLSNAPMARQYGKVYFVVYARPKNPRKFQNTNTAEIFRHEFFNDPEAMRDNLLKAGFDGLEIVGREVVNYTPGNVLHFTSEAELFDYWDHITHFVATPQHLDHAAQFAGKWLAEQKADMSDETFRTTFERCVMPPRPFLYPLIREAIEKLGVKAYKVSFVGRRAEAIGIFYRIDATVQAVSDFDFVTRLYEKYEHIQHLTVNGEPFDCEKAFANGGKDHD